MEILIGASLISAFMAGIAALFAPCCITVLLPAYLGSIFKQRRTVFLMTFVFFLGLLLVFLPLGLGVAGLGQLFSQYHDAIFSLGALFLLFLGTSILLGRHFSMPFSVSSGINVSNAGSVFGLGIFSGFATLCCAPVLAGVLALAVIPGSIFWGGMYSIAYVLGMVIPLFLIAYFLDRKGFTDKFWVFRRRVSYKILGKTISVMMADVLSGVTFVSMGVLILYLALTKQLAMGGSVYQTSINILVSNLTEIVNRYLGQVPAAVPIIAIFLVLAVIARTSLKKAKNKKA